jgi:hypothetical protein
LHEPQAHDAIVDASELVAGKVDEIDLDAIRRQPIEQRFEQAFGLAVQEARAMDQVHADDAERLLLRGILEVEHADVDEDLLVGSARPRLELDAHPAVALVVAAETAGRHRVGKREERGAAAAPRSEPFEVQALLVLEHGFEPLAADVPRAATVDRIADLHVVGGDALGDRPRSATRMKEPTHDLLAGADLGESAVVTRVKIDLQGLVPRRDGMRAHCRKSSHCARNGLPYRGPTARAIALEVGAGAEK